VSIVWSPKCVVKTEFYEPVLKFNNQIKEVGRENSLLPFHHRKHTVCEAGSAC